MAETKTVSVPHLGGIDASYRLSQSYDDHKPTVILVNSFGTNTALYDRQYSDKLLTDKVNLLAIELLGHGRTRTKSKHFTYWDTAIMNLQVMEALGIKKAFALGTSQGGWVVARMALLRPDMIEGLILLGTSMDHESERSRKLGCWNPFAAADILSGLWDSKVPTPDFVLPDVFCDSIVNDGFGHDCPSELRMFWRETFRETFRGDNGRQRIRMDWINLATRDGLHGRLMDITCPVIWLHGTGDTVYSVANAEEEIKMFTDAASAELRVVSGGKHFLSATHPEEVDQALAEFVKKWHGTEPSKLRPHDESGP